MLLAIKIRLHHVLRNLVVILDLVDRFALLGSCRFVSESLLLITPVVLLDLLLLVVDVLNACLMFIKKLFLWNIRNIACDAKVLMSG